MLRRVSALAVSLLITACGKFGHSTGRWPAVVALDTFASEERELVLDALDDLNVKAQRTIVSPQSLEGAFPVSIQKRSPWPEAPARAGFATLDGERCTVELSSILFTDTKRDFLKSVLWHELGHCAGLPHTTQDGEIMFSTSAEFHNYTLDAVERFLASLRYSAGL